MHTTRDTIAGSRVLVIDSDHETREAVRHQLTHIGLIVRSAADGKEGMQAALAIPRPDLIITELGLPHISGTDVLRRLRARGHWVPVIIATSTDDDCAHELAIHNEVVDIIAKPFTAETLRVRVTAALKRVAIPKYILRYCDLTLDLSTRRARRGERVMQLTPADTELLLYFMEHPEAPISPERLLEEVCGVRADTKSQAYLPRISRLRQKLHGPDEPPILHTVPSMGYMLALPDLDNSTLEGLGDVPWPGSFKEFGLGDQ